jgi:hypothetical protein
MTGLVFVDTLTLTVPQWIALLVSMALLLWSGASWKSLVCIHCGLVAAFWNSPLSTDTRLLFQSAADLQRFTWAQFLSEFAYRDYVKLQPPFYTFWVSRWPSLPTHQVGQGCLAVFLGILMMTMYGDKAKYVISTPIYLLMSTQPGNDFALFACLVCVLRLVQFQRSVEASVLYGLTFLVKPLMLITVPFLVPWLRGWTLISCGLIACYYAWSAHYHFGIMQWDFLAQQLLLKKLFALWPGAGSI